MNAVARARKCASGEGLNSRSLCLPKCERACPALMRSCGCTFASGEGLNSLHMCCHKCPCVRSARVRMCALMRAGWRGAELVLHVCSEMDACAPGMNAVARAQVREWRGAQLAKHVRSQMQARENVRARELHILLFLLVRAQPRNRAVQLLRAAKCASLSGAAPMSDLGEEAKLMLN